MKVRPERTGFRDQRISERHRKWGWDCPAIDIDWLVIEYDTGEPVALVEYKHQDAMPQYRTHPTYKALIRLGDRVNIPVFSVRYADDFKWWKITPLNRVAKSFILVPVTTDEYGYVAFLYRLRGREIPCDVAEELMLNNH